MFKDARWVKKEVAGSEYSKLISKLLEDFTQEEIENSTQSISWKLYDMYAAQMSVEERDKISDRELISFVDTSFTYEYFKDKLILKMRYGIQPLSNKPFIINDTKTVYFPGITDAEVERKIKNDLRAFASYTEVKALSANSCFDGSFSIIQGDNVVSELKSSVNLKIFVEDINNNIPEILLAILGMKENESRVISLGLKTSAKISIEKIYEVKYPEINRETIEKMNIFSANNKEELFNVMKKQLALSIVQKSIKSYLEYLGPRCVFENNIEINPDYVEGFFSKENIKAHTIALDHFGDFQKYLEHNNLTKQQFYEKAKKDAVDKACVEIFINEVVDKYIYQQDQELFEFFKNEIISSYKVIGKDITQDYFFEENMRISFLYLEVFLTVIKITNPKVYEDRIKGREFPYII